MSIDIQVINVVDDLQVLEQADIEGADPRAIRIRSAGGFTDALRVVINDFGIDSFTLVNDTVIIVEPGPSLDNVAVENMDIVVVSSVLTNTRRARLFFGPTKRLSRVSGIQKLIQVIVKILLSNINSNKYRLSEGGSLLQLLGFSMTPAARSRLVAVLSQAVTATEEQLTSAQASASGLALDERLLSLNLGEVLFFPDTQEVQASIGLTTFAGRTVQVPLIL